MIQITFPDGNARQFEPGVTSFEIARSISEGLSQKVLSAKVNGEVWDLSRPISKNATLQLLTWDDKDGKTTFWHSTAHLMAEALESLFPNIKFGTGPAIESGFYYDVDTGTTPLSSEDFVKIENEMIRLARLKNQYVRKDICSIFLYSEISPQCEHFIFNENIFLFSGVFDIIFESTTLPDIKFFGSSTKFST